MRIGSTEEYKERIRLDEEQAKISTAVRKAKKVRKAQIKSEISEQYISPRNTGRIDWIPKHSLTGKERWLGMVQDKKMFQIESGTYTYGLRVLDKTITKGSKSTTERSFEVAAKKAEIIIENYLKLLKKKNKDEVSQNNSASR
jgi:hypothetical protein